MVNPKKLIEMARKWQKMAALGRRRLSVTRIDDGSGSGTCTSVASKGHFVAYTRDGKRFVVPLAYLNHNIFKELFRMSEEEFGLPCNRPIILPCDAVFMEYVVALLRRRVSKDVEKALLNNIVAGRCSASFLPSQGSTYQHGILHGF